LLKFLGVIVLFNYLVLEFFEVTNFLI